MSWLTELHDEHSLFQVAEECADNMSETYYMLIAEQKQESHPDD